MRPLTREPDLDNRLEVKMRRFGGGMTAVVKRALRAGLGMTDKAPRPEPFEVIPHGFALAEHVSASRVGEVAGSGFVGVVVPKRHNPLERESA